MELLEQQVQALIEERDDLVVLLDTNGFVLLANNKWINYCPQREWPAFSRKIGMDYLGFLKKTRNLVELENIQDMLQGKAQKHFQLNPSYTGDRTEWLSTKYRSFPLDDGSNGVILYQQPVNLQSVSSLHNEHILENMTDAFYLLDHQMNFYFLNAQSEQLLHCQRENLIGKNLWAAFPETTKTALYPNYNRAMQERVPVKFTEYYKLLDSWFTVRVYPIENDGLAVYYQTISKQLAIEEGLGKFACADYLTGLPTRRKIEEEIGALLQKDTPFSLLYLNLDNFKYINTFYTHKNGDKVIKSIVARLKKLIDAQDLVGRLEGDELVIVRRHRKDNDVLAFTKKVSTLFNQPFSLGCSNFVDVSASIGVISCPADSQEFVDLMTYSEIAMRKAKGQKGSSFCIFDSTMSDNLTRRMLIEQSLTEDLKSLGFYFAIQPQIDAATSRVRGVEVLARWHHPELGMISPIEFIAIAEETDTIERLTEHLMVDVFSYMKTRENQYGSMLPTAINITPSLLDSTTFFDKLFSMLDNFGISPTLIEIEITESVELRYSETTLTNLLACRAKGISIALDDFGTEFSSLAYLLDFPVNKIKMDKSFINKIGYDPKSEAVLKSLIQFVNSVDCALVAEGVEQAHEALFLTMNGCNIHQGYLYDKPMLPKVFDEKYLNTYRLTSASKTALSLLPVLRS
ncbi:PAS/PAC sensor-containing diguanylate cyclase/phosphodiesterase [Planococcus antarcticus DSM 14505]|uniref:PAS/PAC sensor-containing diguanylate cyclase/phosphodiesterase n=1 Tax=Planococcus antarcticus DSM 14505 TaxID=1185653 RepID=A0AA87IPP3_9BACL|nr:GGDEF and EAL domain-containing protein [Planococcus antarcticus]EIM08451.1 PAS/PAC sensor-containing diguanylate cyclase/phosphodiesterase [Planococcus antarcticus DSM 14505]